VGDKQITREKAVSGLTSQHHTTSVQSSEHLKTEDKTSGGPTKEFLNKIAHNQYTSEFSKGRQSQARAEEEENQDGGGFAAVLGLPPITVETLYQQHKEKDEIILELMAEHSNYVKVYEGYPDMIQDMQAQANLKGKKESQALGNLKVVSDS
jgi:uncharacterized spore protein YtfJ